LVAQRVRARELTLKTHRIPLISSYGQQAIGLFLENFVLNPFDAKYSKGYLASLLPMLRYTKSDSLLSQCVDAVGLCFLAASTTNDSIASQASRSYVSSLNYLQRTLNHKSECVSNETLISVYLMGLYEVSVNEPAIKICQCQLKLSSHAR
jgi:hypothetical protein